ncbi:MULTISPECIES: hypothetical protein [unclassified Leucobacter]|uniref:hypothetical protein n=1 Tax=unclassified Leucobacter TaxID=2621730 RepID=UPI0030193C90
MNDSESTVGETDWLLRSRFKTVTERSKAVQQDLRLLLESRSTDSSPIVPTLDPEGEKILDRLLLPLRGDPPEASQAAEAALTIAQFALTEERVLNVIDPSKGDLTAKGRLASDRSVSDYLCKELLAPRNIPATQGPLQSSTFRSGYLAAHARSAAFRDFVIWQSSNDRTLNEVRVVAVSIVDAFLSSASSLPAWPSLIASRLTFTTYRRVRDRLLATGSGGALEQYLLAGLLEQEMAQSTSGLRIETKNVGANDRATKSAGDIEIRYRQALRGAIEVSAANWSNKVPQLEVAASAGLKEVTIVAAGVAGGPSGDELAEAIDPTASRLGIDPAVVDLFALMDVISSRITPHGRAAAFHFVYQSLVRFHSREPALAVRLVQTLEDLGLTATDDSEAVDSLNLASRDVEDVIDLVRAELAGKSSESLSGTLRDIANKLENPKTTDDFLGTES